MPPSYASLVTSTLRLRKFNADAGVVAGVALTDALLVTHNVYVVSFVLLHHATVIFSLHVNVKTNAPLVHAASVIVQLGAVVSTVKLHISLQFHQFHNSSTALILQ